MAASTTIDPAWTLDNQNTAFNGRHVVGADIQQAVSQTSSHVLWRDGVFPKHYNGVFTDLLVVDPASPGMNVRVYQGSCLITRTGQGPYMCVNSLLRTVALDASNPSLPRIDLIVAQVTDVAIGDGSSAVVLKAVAGTPAASPVPMSPPVGSIPLAQVLVGANVSTILLANITDRRKSTGTTGVARPLFIGDAVGDAGVAPGEMRVRAASGVLPQRMDMWTGAAWRGTQPISLAPVRGATASGFTTGSPVAMSVSVPDPGWSYVLEASGALAWDQTAASTTIYSPKIFLTNSSGPVIAAGQLVGLNQQVGTGAGRTGLVARNRLDTPITGASVVQLVLLRDAGSSGGGGVEVFTTASFNTIHVTIVPV